MAKNQNSTQTANLATEKLIEMAWSVKPSPTISEAIARSFEASRKIFQESKREKQRQSSD